jgi:hypothetical protein
MRTTSMTSVFGGFAALAECFFAVAIELASTSGEAKSIVPIPSLCHGPSGCRQLTHPFDKYVFVNHRQTVNEVHDRLPIG